MATWTFRPAVREQIRLLIGLSGPTGSGKTLSALMMAKALTKLAGVDRFAVLDTENGRASLYAPPTGGNSKDYPGTFDFDVVELSAPFTSENYQDAILAAEAAKYPVIVVDSFSHEYEGDGGILDRHETEVDEMVKQSRERGDTRKDWQLEEAHNMRAWNAAKAPHKKLVTKLLQLRCHVIFCMRADDKIEITKKDGKTIIEPKKSLTGLGGYIPICERKFPYELTLSLLFTPDVPGVPKPIKLLSHHKAFFPLDKPITEECGRLLGEWAKGGSPKNSAPRGPESAPAASTSGRGDARGADTVQPVRETKPGIYEPQGSEIVTAKPWTNETTTTVLKKIESAATDHALQLVGEIVKGAPDAAKDILRDVYAARLKQLRTPKNPQPPQPADEAVNERSASQAEVIEEELPI